MPRRLCQLFLAAGLVVTLAACGPGTTTVRFPVQGRAMAGPTCPVEPPSPEPGQCAERPVGNAVLVVTDDAGHEVARATTGADGSFSVMLPAGAYTLTPQPVPAFIGGARPVAFVVSGEGQSQALDVEYDTGIR